MKNKLVDLNNHLFEQLERLNDDDLKEEDLEKEIKRARSMTSVATQIISSGELILNAQKIQLEYGRTKFTPIGLLNQNEED